MDIVNLVSDEENESLEFNILKEDYKVERSQSVIILREKRDNQKLRRSEISDNVITQKDDLEVFTISDTSEDEDDIYVCPECRKEYNGEQYLERHMKREHNLNADDYKVFGVKLQYRKNDDTFQSSGKKCDICRKKFINKEILSKHIKEVHFGIKQKDQKKRSNEDDQRFQCFICCKIFQYKAYLQRHMLQHNSKRIHKCSMCGLKYIYKYLLNRHIRKHQKGELNAKCPYCNGNFTGQQGVKRHIQHSHKDLINNIKQEHSLLLIP